MNLYKSFAITAPFLALGLMVSQPVEAFSAGCHSEQQAYFDAIDAYAANPTDSSLGTAAHNANMMWVACLNSQYPEFPRES